MTKTALLLRALPINEGQALKRFHPSTRGRMHPYKKRSSHITIVLKEKAVKKVAVSKIDKADDETRFVKTKSAAARAKADKGGKK